jgi:hypothetical protein
LRLRIINLLGAVAFTVYGVLISAYPVAVVNFFIVLINLYYLRGMMNTHEFFQIVDVNAESAFLRAFIAHYAEDMQRLFTHRLMWRKFSLMWRSSSYAIWCLQGSIWRTVITPKVMMPSLWMWIMSRPNTAILRRGASFMMPIAPSFDKRGIRRIFSTITPDADYLKKMGFHSAQDNLLVKELV